jgi:hypothetical protein
VVGYDGSKSDSQVEMIREEGKVEFDTTGRGEGGGELTEIVWEAEGGLWELRRFFVEFQQACDLLLPREPFLTTLPTLHTPQSLFRLMRGLG